MNISSTLRSSGQVNDYIHHIDLKQYNFPELCSAFVLKTQNSYAIMDCGTSNDIPTLLDYITSELNLSLKRIGYLIPTHYHFDHFGGGWKLWETLMEYNPDIKILKTEKTKEQLQHPELHMERAQRTFGDFIGEMNPIIDEAFEIVNTDEEIPLGLKKSQSFQLIKTPGHVPDHVCPTLFNGNQVIFSFVGEASGGLFNIGKPDKPVILGTSMPPEFDFTKYTQSLKKIQKLLPQSIGLGHFGAVLGEVNVSDYLNESLAFATSFRNFVREKYEERNETKYIVEQFIEKELAKKIDVTQLSNGFLTKIIIALVYGQLIDLGFRKPK